MSDSRPDIIVIMVDDMGYSDLGCYGGEIETPNIDALAERGVRFTQFYNCARCCPTRASLLTGLYPHRAGIGHMTRQNDSAMTDMRAVARGPYQGYLSSNTVTVAEALRDSGYQTFMSGKWHVGSFRPNWPKDRGFDRYYGILGGACNYWDPEPERGLIDEDEHVTEISDGFYTTDAFSDKAVEFVDGADPDKPYYLHLMYTAPHWPLHAWPEDIQKYKGRYKIGWDEIRERRAAKQKELGLFPDDVPLSPRDPECPAWDEIDSVPDMKGRTFSEDEWDHRMAVYAAMIDRVDQGIGRLLDRIREKRDLDNTVIVFLADNGACAESHDPVPDVPAGPKESDTACFLPWANASNTPFRLFKHWLHEGGSATPFIFHWPKGVRQNHIETDYYAHVKDVMPTCLEIAGASYPLDHRGYPVQRLDGQSLMPNLRGQVSENPETLYLEHEGNRAVRRGKWKLVSYYSEPRGFTSGPIGKGDRTGPWELYDLEADRVELNDLSDKEVRIKEELIEAYGAFAERTGVSDWNEIQRDIEKFYAE